jgi:hypothetical protein
MPAPARARQGPGMTSSPQRPGPDGPRAMEEEGLGRRSSRLFMAASRRRRDVPGSAVRKDSDDFLRPIF